MNTKAPPPPPPPPAATAKSAPPPSPKGTGAEIDASKFAPKSGRRRRADRVFIYGPKKSAKTSLVRNKEAAGDRVLYLDIERSGEDHDFRSYIDNIDRFDELLSILRSPIVKEYDTIAVDTLTELQEMIEQHIIANCSKYGMDEAVGMESWGYGKAYTFMFDLFLEFLGALDALYESGKDIVLVAHAFKVMEKNPSGEDWLKWKPRLQDSTKCNIQERVMEWADHVVFIKPDVAVNSKTHKGKGGMSLMIHTQPAAGYEAGSRTLNEDMPYPEGSADLWTQLKGHHNGMA